jgi:IS1 family transposase
MIEACSKIRSYQPKVKERIMANHLPISKKALVLSLLTDGQSIRATSRIADVSQPTILRVLLEAGERARDLHDRMMLNLKCRYVETDEIWCFVRKKQKYVTDGEREYGDQYVFIALDAETKLVVCYRVGKRTIRTTDFFMSELAARVATRFQLSSDAFTPYADAVDRVFGTEIDYAQIHKDYRETPEEQRRYSPGSIIRVTKRPIMGEPRPQHISTSYVERQNLTVRMQMRRFTRLTNGFSKKLRNLEAAVALHFFFYNFVRIHTTLRITPAMQAGITDRLWTWEDLLTWGQQVDAA